MSGLNELDKGAYMMKVELSKKEIQTILDWGEVRDVEWGFDAHEWKLKDKLESYIKEE